MSEWIAVTDALPEMATHTRLTKPYVLVVDTKGRMAVAYGIPYSDPDDGIQWVSGKAIGEVVAWMPLPKYEVSK